MSHATATEVPAATGRLYREPRYPTGRATENLSSSNVSISGATEVRLRSDHHFRRLSSTGIPRCETVPSQAMVVFQHTLSALPFHSRSPSC
jgi:hypothetical protein